MGFVNVWLKEESWKTVLSASWGVRALTGTISTLLTNYRSYFFFAVSLLGLQHIHRKVVLGFVKCGGKLWKNSSCWTSSSWLHILRATPQCCRQAAMNWTCCFGCPRVLTPATSVATPTPRYWFGSRRRRQSRRTAPNAGPIPSLAHFQPPLQPPGRFRRIPT